MLLRRAITRPAVLLAALTLLVVLHPQREAAAQTVVGTVPLPGAPLRVAVNPTSNRAYIANPNALSVNVIDAGTNQVTGKLDGKTLNIDAVAVNPVTNRVYFGDGDTSGIVVRVFDGATNTLVTSIPVAGAGLISALAVHPGTDRVYAVQHDLATNDSQLVVLDGEKNTVLATAPAGREAWSLDVGLKANRVYVTGWAADGSGSLLVLDAGSYAPLQTVPVGARPMDVAVDQATGRIFVANAGGNSVSVIDGQTFNVTTVPVGGSPTAVGVNYITGRAYVSVPGMPHRMVVLDGAAAKVIGEIPLMYRPRGVAANPSAFRVYVAARGDSGAGAVIVIEDVRDMTPPLITPVITPVPNAAGWSRAPVNLTWKLEDPESGAKPVQGCEDRSLAADTAGITFTCIAINGDGRLATLSTTIRIDTTAPTVMYTGNAGNYTVDQTINITCSAADALSGLETNTCDDMKGPAWAFMPGWHMVTAKASDRAGNEASASVTFTIRVTYAGLCVLTRQFSTDVTLANTLCDWLRDAETADSQGQSANKAGWLSWYMNTVAANEGQAFTSDQMATLIRLARSL